MSPQIYHGTLGVEEVLEAVEIVLSRDINDCLRTVYDMREEMDRNRAERRGYDYRPLTYDDVPPDHFHAGAFPHPVLDNTPKDSYPFIVLTVDDVVPDAEDARSDHIDIYRDNLMVHALARASEAEGAEIVFRRGVRMAQAAYLAIASDPVTRDMLLGLSNPVRGQHSIPWTYQEKGRGPDWWFQAVGTSYALKTRTTLNQ